MKALGRTIALLGIVASLQGCGEKKPLLTLEALSGAARKCGVPEVTFRKPGDASSPPSFSYLDPAPASDRQMPVSACLADALKDYRFAAMEIRFRPSAATAP